MHYAEQTLQASTEGHDLVHESKTGFGLEKQYAIEAYCGESIMQDSREDIIEEKEAVWQDDWLNLICHVETCMTELSQRGGRGSSFVWTVWLWLEFSYRALPCQLTSAAQYQLV